MEERAVHPRVAEALASLGVRHEVIACDPAHADTAAFCARYGYPPETSGNAIIVASRRGPKRFAACVVQATRRLDVNHRVRRLMGAPRASFAGAEETVELTGMEIGGVTPFGLPAGLPVYLDEALLELPYVVLGSGTRRSKLIIDPDGLARIPGARFEAALGIALPEKG